MKAKLLKKLRKQIVLLERNGRFKVDVDEIGGVKYSTNWIADEKEAKKMRREEILSRANVPKYKNPKRVIR